MGRYKKYLTILLMFSVYIMPLHSANALPWNTVKATATAAGASVTGSANVGGAIRNAAANVPWGQIKSGLGKGMIAGGLLTAAVAAGLGATDYVMDPANNSVTYKPQTTAAGAICSTAEACSSYQYLYKLSDNVLYSTFEAACNAYIAKYYKRNYGDGWVFSGVSSLDREYPACTAYNASQGRYNTDQPAQRILNSAYDSSAPAQQDQTKTISIPDLIQKLIDQMNNNDAAIKNVLDQILESSIVQAQAASNTDADLKAMLNALTAALDGGATYPAVGTATGTATNTATGTDLKLDFPAFCGWAGIVCEAANTAINFPTTVGEWWKTVVGWNGTLTGWWTTLTGYWQTVLGWRDSAVEYVDSLFAEPEQTDNELDIPQTDGTTQPDSSINLSTSCPSKIPLTFSWNGQSIDFSFDFSIWCQAISTYVYPIVVLLGALHALYIVSGVRQDG